MTEHEDEVVRRLERGELFDRLDAERQAFVLEVMDVLMVKDLDQAARAEFLSDFGRIDGDTPVEELFVLTARVRRRAS